MSTDTFCYMGVPDLSNPQEKQRFWGRVPVLELQLQFTAANRNNYFGAGFVQHKSTYYPDHT